MGTGQDNQGKEMQSRVTARGGEEAGVREEGQKKSAGRLEGVKAQD